jgi:phosphoglycolate phosphatase
MIHPLTAILFDLDGTLVDPAEGITRSMQFALEQMDQPIPPRSALLPYIGPPLRRSFATLIQTDEPAQVERAMTLYRQRYATVGLFENQVYEGIPALLASLNQKQFRLFLATAKPHLYARRILAHHGLGHYFAGVYGSELDGHHDDKGELLAYLLKEEGLFAAATLMVGDREHDIRAARQNGLRAIGVTYGYGSAEELTQAGANGICHTPREIGAFVQAESGGVELGN